MESTSGYVFRASLMVKLFLLLTSTGNSQTEKRLFESQIASIGKLGRSYTPHPFSGRAFFTQTQNQRTNTKLQTEISSGCTIINFQPIIRDDYTKPKKPNKTNKKSMYQRTKTDKKVMSQKTTMSTNSQCAQDATKTNANHQQKTPYHSVEKADQDLQTQKQFAYQQTDYAQTQRSRLSSNTQPKSRKENKNNNGSAARTDKVHKIMEEQQSKPMEIGQQEDIIYPWDSILPAKIDKELHTPPRNHEDARFANHISPRGLRPLAATSKLALQATREIQQQTTTKRIKENHTQSVKTPIPVCTVAKKLTTETTTSSVKEQQNNQANKPMLTTTKTTTTKAEKGRVKIKNMTTTKDKNNPSPDTSSDGAASTYRTGTGEGITGELTARKIQMTITDRLGTGVRDTGEQTARTRKKGKREGNTGELAELQRQTDSNGTEGWDKGEQTTGRAARNLDTSTASAQLQTPPPPTTTKGENITQRKDIELVHLVVTKIKKSPTTSTLQPTKGDDNLTKEDKETPSITIQRKKGRGTIASARQLQGENIPERKDTDKMSVRASTRKMEAARTGMKVADPEAAEEPEGPNATTTKSNIEGMTKLDDTIETENEWQNEQVEKIYMKHNEMWTNENTDDSVNKQSGRNRRKRKQHEKGSSKDKAREPRDPQGAKMQHSRFDERASRLHTRTTKYSCVYSSVGWFLSNCKFKREHVMTMTSASMHVRLKQWFYHPEYGIYVIWEERVTHNKIVDGRAAGWIVKVFFSFPNEQYDASFGVKLVMSRRQINGSDYNETGPGGPSSDYSQ